jgi:mannosylglycoprotein endo-beta-mannosidase
MTVIQWLLASHLLAVSLVVVASLELELDWKLCPIESREAINAVAIQGARLSQQGPDIWCINATVPGTVLANLLANGTFGFDDPYFEKNLEKIPDINITGPEAWTFFYLATFDINAEHKDEHVLLQLRSINYKAELWLDGVSVIPSRFPGTPDPNSVQGMFQRFFFPLGQLGSGRHYLTILVHPPPNPGSPNGGQGGSHVLAKDGPVSQFLAGWDWCQATPDRNTGLWDKATIQLTGPLQLRDPTVRIQNLNVSRRMADLYFSVSVDNRARNTDRCAIVALGYTLDNPDADPLNAATKFTHYIRIHAPVGATNISAEFPQETLVDAQLWYPHTHGIPSLYRARLGIKSVPCSVATTERNLRDTVLDEEVSFRFGVRSIDVSLNETLGGLEVKVNGQRAFLQGGNWIATDQLMRFADDPARAAAEVGLHRAMGFNLIRVWGGGITERPAFFDACDELGVLVLSDLWMSGDNNGRWAGSYSWPLNHTLYLAATQDTFLLLRNHPSLIMYSGGNELYPTSKNPPPDILRGTKAALKNIDPDTFFIVSTMTNSSHFDPAQSLAPLDGPYHIMQEELFYERNPDLWDWHNHTRVRFRGKLPFQPEIGSVSHPTLASLLRFMKPKSAAAFPGFGDSNVHPVWEYHKFAGFAPKTKATGKDLSILVDHVYQYGVPRNM